MRGRVAGGEVGVGRRWFGDTHLDRWKRLWGKRDCFNLKNALKTFKFKSFFFFVFLFVRLVFQFRSSV